jgi:hypothetical protein
MRIVVPMGGLPPSSFTFGETARSARTRGVVNDALTIYFLDATNTSAFRGPLVRGAEGRGFS